MKLTVSGTMQIDGEVAANGGAGSAGSGGGSGGSIWIEVEHMQVKMVVLLHAAMCRECRKK